MKYFQFCLMCLIHPCLLVILNRNRRAAEALLYKSSKRLLGFEKTLFRSHNNVATRVRTPANPASALDFISQSLCVVSLK